jgi:hypothetical protein
MTAVPFLLSHQLGLLRRLRWFGYHFLIILRAPQPLHSVDVFLTRPLSPLTADRRRHFGRRQFRASVAASCSGRSHRSGAHDDFQIPRCSDIVVVRLPVVVDWLSNFTIDELISKNAVLLVPGVSDLYWSIQSNFGHSRQACEVTKLTNLPLLTGSDLTGYFALESKYDGVP